jgi:hypothetical protein
MSNSEFPSQKPIPMGILVPASNQPTKTQRPAPKRPSASADRQIPWLYIAVGGSAAWVIAIVTIAFCASGQEPPPAPGPLFVQNNPGGNELNPNAPKGFVAPAIDEFRGADPEPKKAAPPKLARQAPPRQEDVPPPIDLNFPEDGKPAVAVEAPLKPKNLVDTNIFANCEQIGSNILFHKNPPDAFDEARKQKKIVFMVHLSGNLEDKDFT